MSFKDRSWARRFEEMGDEAEGVFEDVCDAQLKLKFVRYGLNRPPIQMHKLPARIRYTPDYLMSAKFVEVQGVGRDQTVKLKLDKWGALRWWNDVHPVELFVWDSHHERWCFVTLDQLQENIRAVNQFPEGHAYFEYDADVLFDATYRVGEYQRAAAA